MVVATLRSSRPDEEEIDGEELGVGARGTEAAKCGGRAGIPAGGGWGLHSCERAREEMGERDERNGRRG